VEDYGVIITVYEALIPEFVDGNKMPRKPIQLG
jgi:hypothetical protein